MIGLLLYQNSALPCITLKWYLLLAAIIELSRLRCYHQDQDIKQKQAKQASKQTNKQDKNDTSIDLPGVFA
jgi:hypothetical protein